jgi:hypothetical protein
MYDVLIIKSIVENLELHMPSYPEQAEGLAR